MNAGLIEQVFLESRAGLVEALLVLENEAGSRFRERFPLGTPDRREATVRLARHLAGRGVRPARKVRLRVSAGSDLRDDRGLLELFLRELSAGAPP